MQDVILIARLVLTDWRVPMSEHRTGVFDGGDRLSCPNMLMLIVIHRTGNVSRPVPPKICMVILDEFKMYVTM